MRWIKADDADVMLAIWNDPAFISYAGDRGVRSIEQARAVIQDSIVPLYATHGHGPYCVIRKADMKRIGICGLFHRDQLEHPDIGFAVLPEFSGAGFAWEAARGVVEHARLNLGIRTLNAIVSPRNIASIGLIEKLGFALVGGITMPGETEEVRLYSMDLV